MSDPLRLGGRFEGGQVHAERRRYFRFFRGIPEATSRPTPIFVDEFDARQLQRPCERPTHLQPSLKGLGSQSNLVVAFKAHDGTRPTFKQFLDEFPTPVTAVRESIEHAHRARPIASVSGLGRYRSIANAMSDIASPCYTECSINPRALASQFWACALQ